VTSDEVREVRRGLRCSVRELAERLGVEPALVRDWERGERFPTKQHAQQLAELRERGHDDLGPSGSDEHAQVPRPRPTPAAAQQDALQAMADPVLWRLVRKLAVHADLRAEVEALAADFDDPAE
jgi:transcriptional regulator with XRE-family HTH domain